MLEVAERLSALQLSRNPLDRARAGQERVE
jgi:hypothetical protein